MTYTTLSPTEVQMFLDNIGYNPFTVIFIKKDGSQRALTGTIEPKDKRSTAVPVKDEESGMWKSFRVDSVLSITAA
jgi:hypothetical protein